MPKCKQCAKEFKPKYNTTQAVCSWECALLHSKKVATERQWRLAMDEINKKPRKLETLAQQKKLTQTVFNKWVREVKEKSATCCISCGKKRGEFIEHAGHFKSVGASSNLRYDPDNVWLQCASCNTYKSSNAVKYREALVKKIGIKRVERLERLANVPKRWTIDELKELRKKLNREIRENQND